MVYVLLGSIVLDAYGSGEIYDASAVRGRRSAFPVDNEARTLPRALGTDLTFFIGLDKVVMIWPGPSPGTGTYCLRL